MASIKDVAKLAKVSTATVSYVLNKRVDKTISPKVKRRVLAAAKKLNYRPHGPAQALASKRTRNIALILHGGTANLSNTFYSEVLEGMAREIMQEQYHLMFGVVDPGYQGEGEMPEIVAARSVDGVLTMGSQPHKFISDLKEAGVPVAMVDPAFRSVAVPMILVDNRRGTQLSVRHLVGLGHKKIGLIFGRGKHESVVERNQCFLDALCEAGLDDQPQTKQELLYGGGYRGGETLLKEYPEITAILASNDEMALGAMQAVMKNGRKVPQDVSIMGFDGISETATNVPQMATVYVDKRELGSLAVRALLDVIDGRQDVPIKQVARVSLEERSTTGPPRKK